jgi:hypothetical protein
MPYEATVHNVFIASPSDVRSEREIARQVIHEWNAAHAESEKVILQPIGWETHSYPEMGERTQEIINRLVKKSDILVSIFWSRLGSPTGVAASGTIEEIEKHREAKKPTMIYFSNAPVPQDVDTKQYEDVRRLRQKYESEGLIGTFADSGNFRTVFTQNLASRMVEYLSQTHIMKSNSLVARVPAELGFVIVQNQSFVGVKRRKDEGPNAQILTKWNVTNASVSELPVLLLRARLAEPQILHSSMNDIVVTADATEKIYSDRHEIPHRETRRVSIQLYCTLPLGMLNDQIELQIIAEDQLENEYKLPRVTLQVHDPIAESLARSKGKPSHLKWTVYKYGYLLKSNHGYYFVFLQFGEEERADRWFTEYEAGGHIFGDNGIITGNVHGFQTFEEAQAYCEKNAKDLDGMF